MVSSSISCSVAGRFDQSRNPSRDSLDHEMSVIDLRSSIETQSSDDDFQPTPVDALLFGRSNSKNLTSAKQQNDQKKSNSNGKTNSSTKTKTSSKQDSESKTKKQNGQSKQTKSSPKSTKNATNTNNKDGSSPPKRTVNMNKSVSPENQTTLNSFFGPRPDSSITFSRIRKRSDADSTNQKPPEQTPETQKSEGCDSMGLYNSPFHFKPSPSFNFTPSLDNSSTSTSSISKILKFGLALKPVAHAVDIFPIGVPIPFYVQLMDEDNNSITDFDEATTQFLSSIHPQLKMEHNEATLEITDCKITNHSSTLRHNTNNGSFVFSGNLIMGGAKPRGKIRLVFVDPSDQIQSSWLDIKVVEGHAAQLRISDSSTCKLSAAYGETFSDLTITATDKYGNITPIKQAALKVTSKPCMPIKFLKYFGLTPPKFQLVDGVCPFGPFSVSAMTGKFEITVACESLVLEPCVIQLKTKQSVPSRLELVDLGNSAKLAAGESLTGLRLRVVAEGGLSIDYDPLDTVRLQWGDTDFPASYNAVSRLFCFDNLPAATQEGYKTLQVLYTHHESGKKLSHKFSALVTPGKPSLITSQPWTKFKFSNSQVIFDSWSLYITDQFGNICKDFSGALEISIKPSTRSEKKTSVLPGLVGHLTTEITQGLAQFSKITFNGTTTAPSDYYAFHFDLKKNLKSKSAKNVEPAHLKPFAIDCYFVNEEEEEKKKKAELDEDIDDFQSDTEIVVHPSDPVEPEEIQSDSDEKPDEDETICSTYSTEDPQLLEKATMFQNITPLSMLEPNMYTLNSMDLDMSYSAFKEDKSSFDFSSIRSNDDKEEEDEETIQSSVEPSSKSQKSSLKTPPSKKKAPKKFLDLDEDTIASSVDISKSLIASLKTPTKNQADQDEDMGTMVPDTFPANSYPSQSIVHPVPQGKPRLFAESDKESELLINTQMTTISTNTSVIASSSSAGTPSTSTTTQKNKKRIFLSNYESDSDESSVIVSSGVPVLNFDEQEIDKIDVMSLFPRKPPSPRVSPKFKEPSVPQQSPAKNTATDKNSPSPALQTEQLKNFAVSFLHKKPAKSQPQPTSKAVSPDPKKTKSQPPKSPQPPPSAPPVPTTSPKKPAKTQSQKPDTNIAPRPLPKQKPGKQETSSSTQTPPAKKQKVVDPFYDRVKSQSQKNEFSNRVEDVDEFAEDKPKRMKFVLKNSFSQK